LLVLLSGCVCELNGLNPPESESEVGTFVCNPPYMRKGNYCCLDINNNQVCDEDETIVTVSTSTLPPAQTTLTTGMTLPPQTTVSTASTSTMISITVACITHSDCGTERNQTKCYQGNVVTYFEKPTCSRPGRPDAQCVMKSSVEPYDRCEEWEACVNAKCVNASLVTCEEACADKGSRGWHCRAGSKCPAGELRAAPGDAECQPDICCCEATTTTLPGRPASTTTTLPFGGDSCRDVECADRCKTQYPRGANPYFYAVDGLCGVWGNSHATCPEASNRGDRMGCIFRDCLRCCSGVDRFGRECGCLCLGPLYSDVGSNRMVEYYCEWSWPQKIINRLTDYVFYTCPLERPYCRAGSTDCCKYDAERQTHYDCVNMMYQ